MPESDKPGTFWATHSVESLQFPTNPNILMLMVDQLSLPQLWTTSAQQTTIDGMCPNIAWLRRNSCQFWNFYAAAQNCMPSRATLLTGLYAPQTGVLGNTGQDMDTRFPTFGRALQDIAHYSPNNILWFGKWHLSDAPNYSGTAITTDTLPNYGFNTGRSAQIQWPSTYGSANGGGNQGNNGFLSGTPTTARGFACDAAIAADFQDTWTNHRPVSPWFVCVSFVNPHDIAYYPGFFPPVESTGAQGVFSNIPEPGNANGNFQPQYGSVPTSVYAAIPSPWNFEATTDLQGKSYDSTGLVQDQADFLQYYFQQSVTDETANLNTGAVASHAAIPISSDYLAFLNWYFYMISLVDAQIGSVLTSVLGSGFRSGGNPSATTAIIFLSDHGEYAGSHGLHSKGGGVYDEVLRVPLYVMTPSQTGAVPLFQMCSMVDVFRLVVELALGSVWSGWQTDAVYQDQYYNHNQSLLSFMLNRTTAETRFFTGSDLKQYAFILTTTDETYVDHRTWLTPPNTLINCAVRNHVACMRTKSEAVLTDATSAYTGGKLALYGKWVRTPPDYTSPIIAGGVSAPQIIQDYEYYDYFNYTNRQELGNDYPSAKFGLDAHGVVGSGPLAQNRLNDMLTAFGNMRMKTSSGILPATGYCASMLTRPLTGAGLAAATVSALTVWFNFARTVLSGCSWV